MSRYPLALWLGITLVSCRPPTPLTPREPAGLRFCLHEGEGQNCLLRDGRVAAHILASSGTRARLLVAFPAENSGVALWAVAPDGSRVKLALEEPFESFERGGLHGVRFTLTGPASLRIEKILLGSVRLIRDYQLTGALRYRDRVLEEWTRRFPKLPASLRTRLARGGARPEELLARAGPRLEIAGAALLANRPSLDGKHRFQLRLSLESGRIEGDPRSPRLVGATGPLRLRVEAASSYRPYRGLEVDELLRPTAREHLRRLARDPQQRSRHQELGAALRSLAFLSTERKFLAGSWRFLTYFGRDTLMSLLLLRPALAPTALESGLQSVLDRLSPGGKVAHEESLGDQAVLERLEGFVRLFDRGELEELERESRHPLADPVHDYKMVDDDYMLPLLVAAYLDDHGVNSARARAFFARRTPAGRSNLEALAANLRFVLERAAPYARSGEVRDLIPLRDGLKVGDWRDSEEGLGFGRFPASVNAYLVPAALRAVEGILRSQRIDAVALARAIQRRDPGTDLATRAAELAVCWAGARRHFRVRLSPPEVRERLAAFLERGAPANERELLRPSLARAVGLTFDALALHPDGSPVEVMHTDDGFAMLTGALPAEELDERLQKYERRYPIGLRDLHGIYVASPALSGRPADWSTFDRGRYHGTVVWSWHLALLQRGLMRQLEHHRSRAPRPEALLLRLRSLLQEIARCERRVGELRLSELWTVRVNGQAFEPVAFGGAGHADEANALQLWSNLGLAVDLERTRLGLVPPI